MELHTLARQAHRCFPASPRAFGLAEPVEGLLLLRHTEATSDKPTFYESVACLILQGKKETAVGDQRVSLAAGKVLIVSHAVPVVSRITRAHTDEPYLAMIVSLDLSMLRSLYDEVGDVLTDGGDVHALTAHDADGALVDAMSRYLSLSEDPVAARVLLPSVRKEVHFRLLMSTNGGTLRQLLRYDSHASHVARAIDYLREQFRQPVSIPELASTVGMSTSSLHKHFKKVTSTTPLQYLKELRLLEARRLLYEQKLSVSSVAFEVGYESPNQFSREYSRKYGVSPREDRGVASAG